MRLKDEKNKEGKKDLQIKAKEYPGGETPLQAWRTASEGLGL